MTTTKFRRIAYKRLNLIVNRNISYFLNIKCNWQYYVYRVSNTKSITILKWNSERENSDNNTESIYKYH